MTTPCDTMDASPKVKLFGKFFKMNKRTLKYVIENNPLVILNMIPTTNCLQYQ